MTDPIPPGVFIGEMQAPFKWILIHAARFQGVIRVKAGDGEGFVMVRKGQPLGCTFQREGNLLKGKEAYAHIVSFPVVNLLIHRYSGEEMDAATHLLASEGAEYTPAGTGAAHERTAEDAERESAHGGAQAQDGSPHPGEMEAHLVTVSDRTEDEAEETGIVLPSGLDTENLAHLLLGRMLRLPGVQAVSIFGRGSSVLSIGNVELDSLVVLAEDMLEAAKEISSVMRTGPFVHLTLQIPAGKVIIAPYFNEYLCILTGPEVNLGQIRKILKDIPASWDTGGEES